MGFAGLASYSSGRKQQVRVHPPGYDEAVISYCKCHCAALVMDGLTLAASPCNVMRRERKNHPATAGLIGTS